MRRRAFLAGGATGIAGALAGCIGDLLGEEVTESFSNSYDVTAETVVAVSNRNGQVTVRGTDAARLTVSGTKRARSESALDSIEVDVVEGEQFVVAVVFSSGSNFSSRSVDLTVEVPSVASVDRVATSNGNVTVESVAGDVRATSSNGNVTATDVSGYVRLEASNGNVQARGTTGINGAAPRTETLTSTSWRCATT